MTDVDDRPDGGVPGDNDASDGPDVDYDGSSIYRLVGAGIKRRSSDPEMGRGSSGKMCRPQHFRLHEPLVEHDLAAADGDDPECDRVVLAGKRQGGQVPDRDVCSKRPRKPG